MSEEIQFSKIMCSKHFGEETECCKEASRLKSQNEKMREALEKITKVTQLVASIKSDGKLSKLLQRGEHGRRVKKLSVLRKKDSGKTSI